MILCKSLRISINNAKVDKAVPTNPMPQIRHDETHTLITGNTMKTFTLLALVIMTSACTLKVAAPDKPITINLNVKIEHEVRIKVEKELEDLFSEDSDLF
jgi:hypothetical protein